MNYGIYLSEVYSIAFFAFSVFYSVVAVYVLSLNIKGRLNRVFFMVNLTLAFWSFSYSILNSARSYEEAILWSRLSVLGWGTMYSFLLHYFLILTDKKVWLKQKLLYIYLYLPAVINIYIFGINSKNANQEFVLARENAGWINLSNNSLSDYYFYLYYILFSTLGIICLWSWKYSSNSKTSKKTALIITTSFFLGIFLGSLTDVVYRQMYQSLKPQLGVIFAIVPILAVLYSIKKHGVAFRYKQEAENTLERILSYKNRKVFYSVLSVVFTAGSISYLLLDLFINKKEIIYLIWFSGFLLFLGMIIYLLPFSSDNARRQDFVLSLLLACIMPALYFHYFPYGYNNVIWTVPFFLIILTAIFNNMLMNIIVTTSAVLSVILNLKLHGSMLVNIENGDVQQRFNIYIFLSILIFFIGRLYRQRLNLHEMKIAQQEMLSSISSNLISVSPDNLDEKIEQTLKSIGENFGVDRASCYEYSKNLDQVWINNAWHYESMFAEKVSNDPIKASSLVWLVNEYEVSDKVCIPDVRTLPREASLELEALGMKGSRSIISMPIRQNDRLLGFITLQSMMKKTEWAKDKQNLLTLVTNALADAILKVESEKKISYMAYYDALTGLANRTYFGLQLDKMIEIARRKNKLIGVLFFDLDEFKSVNDAMGHDSGDQLLKEISNRLSQTTRKNDSVCRFGGDEFLIMLPMMENIEEIESAAEKVMNAFKAPTRIKEQEFFVTASCGISVYPLDGASSEMLIKSADMAMYEAKGNGKNTYSFCTPVMKEAVQEKMKLTNDLYRAIEHEEFILHYQPQVHIESGRIIGLEALIRWQHPERGLISPGIFIPLAEQTGLIHKMGEWVLKTACVQNKEWQEKGFDPVVMAVNLSVEQFRGNRLIEVIEKALEESRLDPKFLELEITESVAIKEPSYIVKVLRDMKALGVSISIDDFGTEYSSLSRLKELPIDRLKLAMEFVRGIGMGEKDEAISMVIINLAKSLGMRVIAEGVEKETQLNFLKSRVCDEVQGFYFYHPMPADEVEKIMKPKL